eukprot:9311468-Pyramimonas_sp.AAC.1
MKQQTNRALRNESEGRASPRRTTPAWGSRRYTRGGRKAHLVDVSDVRFLLVCLCLGGELRPRPHPH